MYDTLHPLKLHLGVIQKLCRHTFAFFYHLLTTFFSLKLRQYSSTTYPPLHAHLVIEGPPTSYTNSE